MATESEQLRQNIETPPSGGHPLFVPDNPELTEQVQLQQKETQERNIILEEDTVSGVTQDSLEINRQIAPDIKPRIASEQAFYAANLDSSVSDPDDLINSYSKIKADIETTGTSKKLEDITQFLKAESSEATKQAVYNIMQDNTIPVQQRTNILNQYLDERSTGFKLAEEYAERVFDARPEETPQQIEDKEFDLSFFDDRLQYNELVQAESNKHIAQLDSSTFGFLTGFLELTLPFVDGISAQIAKEAAFGEEGWSSRIFNTIFSGEAKVDFRAAMDRLPTEQRIEAAKKALDAISGLPGGDVKKLYSILDLIADPEYATWQRGLDDFIGVLDTTIVGGTLFKLGKLGAKGTLKVASKSPLATAKIADPRKAEKLAAAAITDETGKVAEALGATREEIVAEMILPKHLDDALEDAPTAVLDRLEEIEKTFLNIAEDTSTHGLNYTDVEKLAAKEKVQKSLDDTSGLKLHLNNSSIIDDGERYAGIALYGKTAERGFKTSEDALEQAYKNGILSEDTILYAKDPTTGKPIKVADLGEQITNEYFVGRKFDHVYNKSDVVMLGADAVSPLGAFRGGGYLLDIVSRFDSKISGMFLRAKDVGTAIETRILDIVRKDIHGLNSKQKLNLFKALEDGSANKEVFDTSTLTTKYGMSEKEIQAYFSYRKVSDMLWTFTNRSYKRKLKDSGMSRIVSQSTDIDYYAKPIKDRASINVKHVFDPKDGTIKVLSDKQIDELYKSGGSIGKLNKQASVGSTRTTQILIDNVDSKLKGLPDNPLPYIDGYFQRSYKEHYFVDSVPSRLVVDGTVITKRSALAELGDTISAHGSHTAAKEAAARLSDETGVEHIVRLGREFDVDPLVQSYQVYENSLKATKSRGKHLAGTGDEALAEIEDPIEALIRTVRTVSNHVSMDDVVGAMKEKWVLTYGHLTKDGKFPQSVADIDKKLLKSEKEYGNAVALKELMDTVLSTPAITDKAYQRFMFGIAETLEGTPLKGVSGTTREIGKGSPLTAIRKLPSHFYIALRPLRQIMVQSGQLMQYTFLEPKYLLSGQAAREMTGIMFAAVSRGRAWEKAGMKAAAKAYGGDPKEFSQVVSTYFDKSGLPYSVDANWFVEGIVNNIHESTLKSPLKKAAGIPSQAYNKVVGLGKRVGFDVGEFTNLTGSWLLSKRRWQRANPDVAGRWAEKQYADIIAADARKIQYAMTQPGTFSYQKGMLSVPLQFMAVPHKALLSVTTSKVYSKADKAKIFAANLTLFGGYGVGLNEAFDLLQEEAGFDLDEPAVQVIKGGVLDLAMNSVLHNLFDKEGEDPTKILFSKSFSPFSEGIVPFQDTFSNLIKGDWAKAVLGPSYNVLHFQDGRIARAMKDIATIARQDNFDITEKVIRFLDAGAQVASGYSDYVKYRYAVKHDQLMSSRGKDLGIEVTAAESFSKLLGFQIAEEDSIYSLLRKFSDEKKELEKSYKQYYESMLRIYKTHGETDPALAQELATNERELLKIYTPEEIAALEDYIIRTDRQTLNTTGTSLIRIIGKFEGIGGEARERALNAINGAQISEEQKQTIRTLLNDGIGEEIF